MKLRKLFIVALTFVVVSLFALNFNVSANTVETSELITVQGAQIRTTGNAGIRFVAKEEYAGTNETAYGIILAFGEAEANEEFVIGGTVNGKEVLKGEVQSTKEGAYTATLYNVPEEFYEQKVTARAYVVDGDKVVYSQAVATRSLAEVALAAYEDGDRSEFVVKVYEAVQNAKTTLYYNGGEEAQFENFDAFVKELVDDFQAADTSKTITKETFAAQSGTAIKNVFNQAEMIKKYYWLLEFTLNTMTEMFEANGKEETYEDTYAESEEMLNRILAGDTSAVGDSNYPNARTCVRQVLYALINKTNKGQTAAYNGYVKDFTVESNYAAILPNITTSAEVKLEENATLPTSLSKPYYTFAGWYDNAAFEGEAVTEHNGAKAYYAKFSATEYTVTYHMNGGVCSSALVEKYTIESPTFALPTAGQMTIADGTFAGWYTNANCTGTPVTEIALGTAGNLNLYAAWTMAQATVVELTAADQAVLAKYTPAVYVLGTASAGKYEINGQEYKFGETLFATLTDALSAASADAVIYVFAGEYSLPQTTFSKSVTILGPNADLTSQATRNAEAKVTVVSNNTLNANTLVFNGIVINGPSATTAGNYFYSGESLKNVSFVSCEITNMSTFNRFQDAGSDIVITYNNCTFNAIGQFVLWAYSGRTKTINVLGCYFDGQSCGGVVNSAAALFRIVSGDTYIYNNVFVGDTKETNGGYFNNRGTGAFEVKYNTFKDVTKFICTSSATTHTFDCNLYLTADVAATSSPVSGTGVTADTTVATSVQDLAEKWAAFNNAQ